MPATVSKTVLDAWKTSLFHFPWRSGLLLAWLPFALTRILKLRYHSLPFSESLAETNLVGCRRMIFRRFFWISLNDKIFTNINWAQSCPEVMDFPSRKTLQSVTSAGDCSSASANHFLVVRWIWLFYNHEHTLSGPWIHWSGFKFQKALKCLDLL